MSENTFEIEELVKLISKLPGLGPKSARRITLQLINNRENLIKPLAQALGNVYKNIIKCQVCGNLKGKNRDCSCMKSNFDKICVVENLGDMLVIENSGIYKGHYHILGGTLNSSDQKNKDALLINSLVNRVKKNSINEVILACSATVKGQTTAHYIQSSLKDTKVKISKLALGLPVGGEIEYLDDGTLFSAFKNRGPIVSD